MGLQKQLDKIRPLLSKDIPAKEVILELLSKESESHYRDQGKLLNALGQLANQFKIIPLNSGDEEKHIVSKIKALVKSETGLNAELHYDEEWRITIDNTTKTFGKIPLVYPTRSGSHNIPEFVPKLADSLENILDGTFYCGYWKDTDTAVACPFAFMLIYVPKGNDGVRKALDSFEWNRMGANVSDLISGTVTAKDQLISYRRTTTWLTVLVMIVWILVIGSALNYFLHFHELIIPWKILFIMTVTSTVLWFLDSINRNGHIELSSDKLLVKEGIIPVLPGYRRRKFLRNEIIRVWIKVKSDSAGLSDGPVIDSTSYIVYITTSKPAELRLTPELLKNEAELVKTKIERWVKSKSN